MYIILKEFSISQKQENSHYGIVRNLLGAWHLFLGTSIVFLLNHVSRYQNPKHSSSFTEELERWSELCQFTNVVSQLKEMKSACYRASAVHTDFPMKHEGLLILWWWGGGRKQRWWRRTEVWDRGSTIASLFYNYIYISIGWDIYSVYKRKKKP